MPSLPVVKSRQVIAALEKAGFVQVHQKGSHLCVKRGNLSVTIPIHPGDLFPPNVFRSILRQAYRTPEEFLELL